MMDLKTKGLNFFGSILHLNSRFKSTRFYAYNSYLITAGVTSYYIYKLNMENKKKERIINEQQALLQSYRPDIFTKTQ
jgi:hypothetical protein